MDNAEPVQAQAITIGDLAAMAFGLLPWSAEQVMQTRLRYLMTALHGARQRSEEAKRNLFDIIRLQTVQLSNLQVDKRHRITDCAKLWQFPWDNANEPETAPRLTPEQAAEQLARIVSYLEKPK